MELHRRWILSTEIPAILTDAQPGKPNAGTSQTQAIVAEIDKVSGVARIDAFHWPAISNTSVSHPVESLLCGSRLSLVAPSSSAPGRSCLCLDRTNNDCVFISENPIHYAVQGPAIPRNGKELVAFQRISKWRILCEDPVITLLRRIRKTSRQDIECGNDITID